MTRQHLGQAIVNGILAHSQELVENNIALDEEFLEELSAALFLNASSQGLPGELALALRQAALDSAAAQLGL